jgi:hypothetical protein
MIGGVFNPERSEGALSGRSRMGSEGPPRHYVGRSAIKSTVLLASMLGACRRAELGPPATGPKTAVRAGDAFIECSVEAARRVNRCRVFHVDGKLWCERDFDLQPENRYARAEELKFESFDGETIHLSGGKKLKPLMACEVED